MTEEQNTVEEPEQTIPPPRARRLQPLAHPRPSDNEDAAAGDRTSPFPYAEKFDAWVADETAASDPEHRRDAVDADQ